MFAHLADALDAAGLTSIEAEGRLVGSASVKAWFPLRAEVQNRAVAAAAAEALFEAADGLVLAAVPADGGRRGWGVLATALADEA